MAYKSSETSASAGERSWQSDFQGLWTPTQIKGQDNRLTYQNRAPHSKAEKNNFGRRQALRWKRQHGLGGGGQTHSVPIRHNMSGQNQGVPVQSAEPIHCCGAGTEGFQADHKFPGHGSQCLTGCGWGETPEPWPKGAPDLAPLPAGTPCRFQARARTHGDPAGL